MTGQDPTAATTAGIDTSRPHPARMYDWYLGGKDNCPVDEEMGRQMLALDPRALSLVACCISSPTAPTTSSAARCPNCPPAATSR